VLSAAVSFLISMAVAALLTPLVRALARNASLLDWGGERNVHSEPTPRLGGVAIVTAFYTPIAVLSLVRTDTGELFYENRNTAFGLIASGLIVALLGLFDDVKGARAWLKLSVQLVVAIGLYYVGFRVDEIATPFGYAIPLGWFGPPFTVLWIVGVINALNLIDGLDGLAGGVALFAVGTTFILALARGDALMMLFMGCLGGAVLGFLLYNFNPASIFMGDTGSMFLGLVLAATSIQTNQKSSTTVAILVPLIVLGLPIADTLFAVGRRAYLGKSPFSADRGHIHHRLLDRGLTHRGAVLVLWSICVVLAASALLLQYSNSLQSVVLLAFVISVFVVGARYLGRMPSRVPKHLEESVVSNPIWTPLRTSLRVENKRMLGATTPKELWDALAQFRRTLGASGLCFRLVDEKRPDGLTYSDPSFNQSATEVVTVKSEESSPSVEVFLSACWEHPANREARQELDRALELVCDLTLVHWLRIRET